MWCEGGMCDDLWYLSKVEKRTEVRRTESSLGADLMILAGWECLRWPRQPYTRLVQRV